MAFQIWTIHKKVAYSVVINDELSVVFIRGMIKACYQSVGIFTVFMFTV